jgi:hypothetical protein
MKKTRGRQSRATVPLRIPTRRLTACTSSQWEHSICKQNYRSSAIFATS